MKKRWVLLRRVETYDPAGLRKVVEEGFDLLEKSPRGRVLIKPNVVFANRRFSNHAYTHPDLVAAVAGRVKVPGVTDIAIGESGGFAVPGRMLFKESGYYEMGAACGVPVVDFNEDAYVTIPLKKATCHKTMRCPRLIHEADFKVWMPKLKYHISCEITNALKLNIGSLLHSERMIYHDDRLNEKIVDILEAGYPDIVISDAVIIGHGFESCAKPFHLGAIMVSSDPIAADVVAAQILGYRPEEVRHLKLASERGYGAIEPSSVELLGDVSIEELAEKTKGIESEFQDMQKVVTPIRFYEGAGKHTGRHCYGGCMTSVKGALGSIDARRPGSLKRAREGAIVTGIYDGDVNAGDGVALLLGDCTEVKGTIRARRVKRHGGCPPGVVELTGVLPFLFGMPSPLFDIRDGFKFVSNTIAKSLTRLINKTI
ncbi:MAG: DUF362 domain-containing protein [Pseudomonadota bacterium]